MKKIICTLLLFILSHSLYSQKKVFFDSSHIIKDTLVLKTILVSPEEYRFNFEKNMPWIGAIIIGLLTVWANLIINNRLRKSTRESLYEQLETNKTIALEQIKSAANNAQLDFNKSVLSANRQNWIIELRENISQLLSKTITLSIQKNLTHAQYQELEYLITKIELMLNSEKDRDFISSLQALKSVLLEICTKTKDVTDVAGPLKKVKKMTASTLKTEWERVKKGE